MTARIRVLSDQDYAYFITCTIIDWLPVFNDPRYCDIILASLAYIRTNKHTQLNAFVIMPSHLHLILWPEEKVNPSNVLRDFKRFTSRSISREAIQRKDVDLLHHFSTARKRGRASTSSDYQVWQEGNHPEAIFTANFARQKMDYIHNNPVRAGLVESALDWPYSSAPAYFLGKETCPPTDLLVSG